LLHRLDGLGRAEACRAVDADNAACIRSYIMIYFQTMILTYGGGVVLVA